MDADQSVVASGDDLMHLTREHEPIQRQIREEAGHDRSTSFNPCLADYAKVQAPIFARRVAC